MPSAAASSQAAARHDDIEDYDVGQLSDDPFASPPPSSPNKKRKEVDSGLGIDEEVSVQKRARVPNIKLDDERLLGPTGIPRLRERAQHLKIRGRGHEFSDASRLLSFYQLWLDDLFPKAKFRDALAMVEKAGHKKSLMAARVNWIDEGKPKPRTDEDDDDQGGRLDDMEEPADTARQASPKPGRPQTPTRDEHVPEDDDLYDVTPRAAPARPTRVPDDEHNLDALIAEAEGHDGISRSRPQAQPQASNAEPDADDLDALVAEAEGQDRGRNERRPGSTSDNRDNTDFADEEAAMEEMEGLW